MLNHVFYDKDTVGDLVEDLLKVNPSITIA